MGKLSPKALKERFSNYRRVIEIARKPDKDEFLRTAKVTAVGIGIIGALGFVIFVFYNVIF